jgi:hypothetical protein
MMATRPLGGAAAAGLGKLWTTMMAGIARPAMDLIVLLVQIDLIDMKASLG